MVLNLSMLKTEFKFKSESKINVERGEMSCDVHVLTFRHLLFLGLFKYLCSRKKKKKRVACDPFSTHLLTVLFGDFISICNPLWRYVINETLRTNGNGASFHGSATNCLIGIYKWL